MPLVLPIAGLVVGGILLALGGRELWFAARVYRGDPTPIARVANDTGPVEVSGTATVEDGTVEAPVSGVECLICEWEVQQAESSGGRRGSGTYWKTLDTGLRGGPFRLEDDTASCRIEPAGSVRHLSEHDVTVPPGTTPPDDIREFIERNPSLDPQDETVDVVFTELSLGQKQRFVERRLEPGEQCYVYGRAHYDPSAGRRGGEVNVRIDGEGMRRFLIADSRERVVAWEQFKIWILPALLGVVLIAASGVALL